MNIDNKITQNILMCRRALLNNTADEYLIQNLKDTLAITNTIGVKSSAKIIPFAIKKVLENIDTSQYFNAGLILTFIHNLPLDIEDERKWDFEYFLSTELPSFLDRVKTIPDVKEIALFVCAQLYERYFQNKGAN